MQIIETWYIFVKNNIMKDINGNDLQQPYYDLAMMRREKQMGSRWEEIYGKLYAESGRLDDAFAWDDTPEVDDFWVEVDCGNSPAIPDTSLAELEAWRKEKDISPVEVVIPQNGQTIYAIDQCIIKGFGYSTLTVGKRYMYLYVSDVEFAVIDDKGHQHYFDIKEFDKYFSITPPADTTDWKAKYEELLDKLEFYKKAFEGLKQTVEQNTPTVELTSEPSNFIAECAMRAMQGMLANPSYMDAQDGYYTLKHEEDVASVAFDYAEAMAAEGKKRGHI